ncbi:unnamed protein product [Cuscuta campestris]|uniref:Bromo domain-containing protein n=1 Tax=Cuscuta campestris TaxID=132261 RepID=A0A484KTL8_9ASTE|nr:unnamed protein product [Cuscuta campestris]
MGRNTPSAADVPTLLGTGPFSLLSCDKHIASTRGKHPPSYLRWPHMHAGQVHGLCLREIGGGFAKHHRAPSMRFASYAIAKPSTMVQRMQNIKRLRGHRDAVYCAIFDRLGRYVITGSDDRLVKIWSMETAFCLASCRGHEGDITDLAVSSNNALVASASNDYTIRAWRLPDGMPISVLRGHTAAVTAIAFSPRPSSVYQLLSSSDDGTCRVWDARYSQCTPRVYLPRQTDVTSGMNGVFRSSNSSLSANALEPHQILCCAYNANGTVFVTGSSDRHARVWGAPKPNVDEPDQPSHEIDILSGHEQDVNYVQFSGCAVSSPRCSTHDSLVEDKIPKFRNSWFSHDNIVTCSRDGSAIIWIPKSRKAYVKAGRWAKAYHLKVPPPPMPPQPPRGGPRQRLLPTPRGVNMIVWSLDNRFVLAAIMDCRICVWNANDGSLVHSLTGHTQSTYVLDVHPFNPRIAMSAGYDGQTILWDIWEGTPIRTYEIGRFKLVDGKFSQDGTSIVLSDDVGQIYLLNTGQGESQKDAKYDQFFLGDYRPLIRDAHQNVIDQETQLLPYRRNLQDPLCDSSMIPYPEPYQSMYQRRRLGALGFEWRPTSIKFAVGTSGLSQEYQVLPLADLDIVAEPLPEFLDAMNWEPENDVVNDDTDSEYIINEEYSSEEKGHLCGNSSDPDCSEDEKIRQSHNRRSKRKKSISEIECVTSSGKRIRKRIIDKDVSSSKSKRTGKSRKSRKTAKKNSTKPKPLRPQRVATRYANNVFLHHSDLSTGEEDDASSDYYSSENDSQEGSFVQSEDSDGMLEDDCVKYLTDEQTPASDELPTCSQPQVNVEKKRGLVLKFSIRDAKKPVPLKLSNTDSGGETFSASSSLRVGEDKNLENNHIKKKSMDLGSASSCRIDSDTSENKKRAEYTEIEDLNILSGDMKMSEGYQDTASASGEVKVNISSQTLSGDLARAGSFIGSPGNFVNNINTKEHIRLDNGYEKASADFRIKDEEHMLPGEICKQRTSDCQVSGCSYNQAHIKAGAYNNTSDNFSPQMNGKPKLKPTILKIKSRTIPGELRAPLENTFSTPLDVSCEDDSRPSKERNRFLTLSGTGNGTNEPDCLQHVHLEMDNAVNGSKCNRKSSMDYLHSATDATRRKRTLRLKAASREIDSDNLSQRAVNFFTSDGVSTSRSKEEVSYNDEKVYLNRFTNVPRKSDWLLLSKKEEGYRYIPQLGDEVAYLRQGHQEYIDSSQSVARCPWEKYGARIRAVEVCLVEELSYATVPGSGESCCKITLKFIDPSSTVLDQKFKLTVPELNDFPDFIVEKSRYDAAVKRSWACGDECQVWWRDENEENGGRWWDGKIVSVKDKSNEFPGSPWERYVVKYNSDETDTHLHCPWELQDPYSFWEHPHIDPKSNNRMLSALNKLLHRANTNQDYYGILQLINVAGKVEYINRFPVPLSPDIIHSRLENNYYRSLEALKHDVRVMLGNAKDYFGKNTAVAVKMKRLSDWFADHFSKL